jgi:hypothetical protein
MTTRKITRAELVALHAAGWTSKPAYLHESQHAPKGTIFVQVTDMPTDSYRRLTPPKEEKGGRQ